MSKKQGRIFTINQGEYKGHRAIAHNDQQKEDFINQGKLVVTIFEDNDLQKMIKEKILILASKLTARGFCD